MKIAPENPSLSCHYKKSLQSVSLIMKHLSKPYDLGFSSWRV
jgi:hypothetical protein